MGLARLKIDRKDKDSGCVVFLWRITDKGLCNKVVFCYPIRSLCRMGMI